MNAAETLLFEALRKRFPEDQYALLPQVRNGTGFSRAPRTADAIAMGLWPSRGLHLHGFEMKASRRDWLTELKSAEKAEEIARFCHYWWVVATTDKIVQDDELPQPWGLLVPKPDGSLRQVKAAVFQSTAKAPTHGLLASILRTAQKIASSDSALEAARKEGYSQAEKDSARRRDHGAQALEDLRSVVAQFEEASGVKIDRWSAGKIGDAVRIVTEGGLQGYLRDLRQVHEKAKRVSDLSGQAIAALVESGALKADQ